MPAGSRALARVCTLVLLAGATAVMAPVAHADAPTHTVTVAATASGSKVTTYPAYDASVGRYALIPDSTTAGHVTVTATSSDPGATVTVDGRPVANGVAYDVPRTLSSGDEVSVGIQDAGGPLVSQSWIYLPTGFPQLTVTDDHGSDPGTGYYFMGLASFLSTTSYEMVVDHHGVPVHVRTAGGGQDFKAYTDDQGRPLYYTVARRTGGDGSITGSTYEIDKLGLDFGLQQVFHPADLPGLDFHDSVVRPDGSALLMGETGHGSWIDAVIEIVDPQGNTVFRWNSADHTDPTDAYVSPNGDYAHINSLQWLDDGDVIASFRNLSTVMRIATSAHDGFQPGDVEWELGGKHSTFTYVGDPAGGQCAQHNARMIDATHIEIFDNGAKSDPTGPIGGQSADMCPSPSDPNTRVARPQTRVVTYALDTQSHTATLRQSYQVDGRYAPFAGNWQNESNGDRVIGWSQSQQTSGTPPIATEIGPGGNELWAVQAPGWFSYRVFKYPAPDVQDPVVTTTGLTDGQTLDESDPAPLADFGCTDTGGSSLATCSGSVADGAPLPMTPGAHQLVATATDGAGNTTTRTLHYTVLADRQPDARIRLRGGAWIGTGVVGSAATQTVRAGIAPRHSQRVQVSVRNAGTKPDRVSVCGGASTSAFAVRYLRDGVDVTRAVVRCWRTPTLAPGASVTLDVVVRNVAAAVGRHHTFRVAATSLGLASRHDTVAVAVTGTR
jgi:hypothetical protein